MSWLEVSKSVFRVKRFKQESNIYPILPVQAKKCETFIYFIILYTKYKREIKAFSSHRHTHPRIHNTEKCCAVLMVWTMKTLSAVGSLFQQRNLAGVKIPPFMPTSLSLTCLFPLSRCLSANIDASLPACQGQCFRLPLTGQAQLFRQCLNVQSLSGQVPVILH